MMEPKPTEETAHIIEGEHCKNCGWPLVHACVNDEFDDYVESKGEVWSWWIYCTNKGCKNHEGEGVHYNWPQWAQKD